MTVRFQLRRSKGYANATSFVKNSIKPVFWAELFAREVVFFHPPPPTKACWPKTPLLAKCTHFRVQF